MESEGSGGQQRIMAEVEKAYQDWSASIFRYLFRLAGNREDAEDVMVETFVEAFRTWDKFDARGSRRNWLFAIATNRFRMSKRKQTTYTEPLSNEHPEQESRVTERIALMQELHLLPLSQQQAFLLVKGEGLTAKEAADILGKPIGTVLYDVHKAVHSLRESLASTDVLTATMPCGVEP